MQICEYDEQIVPPPSHYQHQAGFVPPVVSAPSYVPANIRNQLANVPANVNHQSHNGNNANIGKHLSDDDDEPLSDEDMMADDCSEDYNQDSCDGSVISQNNDSNNNIGGNNGNNHLNNNHKSTAAVKTRATSGRKPTRNEKLTPEEEAKRVQRRERNKLAAARCRKRRLDHTNNLLKETDGLEEKKAALQNEIEMLRSQKLELEEILKHHPCVIHNQHSLETDIKPIVSNGNVIVTTVASHLRSTQPLSRPTSLPLSSSYLSQQNLDAFNHQNSQQLNGKRKNNVNNNDNNDNPLVPVQTPSSGLSFLDNVIESGSGFTPILATLMTPTSLMPTPTSAQPVSVHSMSIAVSSSNNNNNSVPTSICSSRQPTSTSDLASPEDSHKLVSL